MRFVRFSALLAVLCCFFVVPTVQVFGQDGGNATTPALVEEASGAAEDAAASGTEEAEAASAGAPALSDEPTAAEVGAFGNALRSAIQAKAWPVVVGLGLIALVYVLRRFDIEDRVGTKLLPWAVLGLSVGGNLGAALAAGVDVTDALWTSGYAAGIAMAGWDLSSMFRKETEAA